MSILIRDGVIWLPIRTERLPVLLEDSDEALAWMLREFLQRASAQEAEVANA